MSVTQREGTEQAAWPGAIAHITLFVEDLEAARRFYREVFELSIAFEDDDSTGFKFGETHVNLLKVSEAPTGSSTRRPWRPATPGSGSSSRSSWTMSTRCASN
jgi:catechol 2,3-dioxygenase-like lactoylglutathione lyase family enzyme